MARKQWLLVLVLLSGACTDGPAAPSPTTGPSAKPPSLITEALPPGIPWMTVRTVLDGRTLELADGTTVRIARLAPPAPCWAEAALAFAKTTLMDKPVRVTSVTPGEVTLALEDGTDYALLAVRQGVLRTVAGDAGVLADAEATAARTDVGLWGPPCDGLDVTTTVPPPPVRTSVAPPPAPPTTTRPPTPPCAVSYRITGQWPGGFQAGVTLRNTGSATITGWTLRWTFADGQAITEMWNAVPRQSGASVSAVNAHYTATIAPGGSVQIGFNGSLRGANSVPGSFTLNGTACSVG